MKLGTTTWRKRNTGKLETTKAAALKFGLTQPVIVEYGPGAAVKNILSKLPEGSKAEWSTGQKIRRDFIKVSESILRKTRLFKLETTEPEEILEIFGDLKPKKIHVIDRDVPVLEAVQRQLSDHPLQVPFETHLVNLNTDTFPHQGDIVIAYNVAKRTENPEASLQKIANSTKAGGLLTTGSDVTPEGFERISLGVYRRLP